MMNFDMFEQAKLFTEVIDKYMYHMTPELEELCVEYNEYIDLIKHYGLYWLHNNIHRRLALDLVLELKEASKLDYINNDFLILITRLADKDKKNYLDYIRAILIPQNLYEKDKYLYYDIKLFNNRYGISSETLTKYLPRDNERLEYLYNFKKDNDIDKDVPGDIHYGLYIMVTYYFLHNEVINYDELNGILLDFINNPDEFYDGLVLNGINKDYWKDNLTSDEKKYFIDYTEMYINNKDNNKQLIK